MVAQEVLRWMVFFVLVLVGLGAAALATAGAVLGFGKLRDVVGQASGSGDLVAAVGLAQALPGTLGPLVDEPDDVLILMLAKLMKRDPAEMVRGFERWLTVVQQAGLVLPQVKDALGVADMPPKPAEAKVPASKHPSAASVTVTCDRCGKTVKGLVGDGWTTGFYLVGDGSIWARYASEDEHTVCEACMHTQPSYVADYADALADGDTTYTSDKHAAPQT
jgi:hypothetical protein